MALPGFFKKPEHKRFNIQPRYWNPEQEEREEREKRIKAELGITDDDGQYIPSIKGRMKSSLRHKHADVRLSNRKSNIRLIIILVILFFAAYMYLFVWNGTLPKW